MTALLRLIAPQLPQLQDTVMVYTVRPIHHNLVDTGEHLPTWADGSQGEGDESPRSMYMLTAQLRWWGHGSAFFKYCFLPRSVCPIGGGPYHSFVLLRRNMLHFCDSLSGLSLLSGHV